MNTILAIGYNALDVILGVPPDYPDDGKVEVAGIHIGGGGPAATAAVAMARLGARVRLITPLTDDWPGLIQKRELETAGVDLSLSPVMKGCPAPKAVILVKERCQERTIFWSRGDLPHLAPEAVSEDWLDDVDLLFADGHEPRATALLARAARRRGLPVVLDAGTVRDGSTELVPICSDVISSSLFAPELTGISEPRGALLALTALGPERVAMTFGKAGCLALLDGDIVHIPAYSVKVRDTTGAGDAFHAGYAVARAEGRNMRECLLFGSATAALKCRDWGGRNGLPSREEVDRLIRDGAPRRQPPPERLA